MKNEKLLNYYLYKEGYIFDKNFILIT